MAKYDEKRMAYKEQDRLMAMFCDILCGLKSRGAVMDFLKDLLNRKERIMLIRRLQIAEMLLDEYTYSEITERLRCGLPTIARVQRWLEFGRGGYKNAILAKKRKN